MSSSFVSFLPTYAKGSRDSARRRSVLMASFQAGFYRADPHLTVPKNGTVLGGGLLGASKSKKPRETGKNDRLIP